MENIGMIKEKVNKDITDKIGTDQEYFYLVGQCISFMVHKYCNVNKCLKENLVAKTTMLSKDINSLKVHLRQLYIKCNKMLYVDDKKFNNALSMVLGYIPDNNKIDRNALEIGYMSNNILK